MFTKSCFFVLLLFVYACAVESVKEKTDQSASVTADAQNSNTEGLSTPDSKKDPAPGRNNRQISDSARKSNSDGNLGKVDNDTTSRTSKSDDSGNINNDVISGQVDTLENKNPDNNLSYEPETEQNEVTDQNTCIDSNHDGKCDDAENLNENQNDGSDSVDDATDVNENQNDMSDNDDSTTQTPCYGADTDGDGTCDALDLDDDGDGIDDDLDICPLEYDPENLDTDKDRKCNGSDPDDDNDGLLDVVETNTGIFVSINDTGTDPLNSDTDGDALSEYDRKNNDEEEIDLGRNPNVSSFSTRFMETTVDTASSFLLTEDGGSIIVGTTDGYLARKYDGWLIKTDATGNMIWDKKFGGENYDFAYSINQTSDNGYIIAGSTSSFGAGKYDGWLIKVDKEGNTLWEKSFGGEENDTFYSIQITPDGGFIIAGVTQDSLGTWLIKTDSVGTKQWESHLDLYITYNKFNKFGSSPYSLGSESICVTSDGSIIIVGVDPGVAGNDAKMIKTDANGSVIWEKTFGGAGRDEAHKIIETDDGGYLFVGSLTTLGENVYDFWLLKTDTDGDMIWEKTFGFSSYDYGYDLQKTIDNGYIIVGSSAGAGSYDSLLIRTDGSGNEIWRKTGDLLSGYLFAVRQIDDGNYMILGSPWGSGIVLRKTDYINP